MNSAVGWRFNKTNRFCTGIVPEITVQSTYTTRTEQLLLLMLCCCCYLLLLPYDTTVMLVSLSRFVAQIYNPSWSQTRYIICNHPQREKVQQQQQQFRYFGECMSVPVPGYVHKILLQAHSVASFCVAHTRRPVFIVHTISYIRAINVRRLLPTRISYACVVRGAWYVRKSS